MLRDKVGVLDFSSGDWDSNFPCILVGAEVCVLGMGARFPRELRGSAGGAHVSTKWRGQLAASAFAILCAGSEFLLSFLIFALLFP